MIYICGTCKKEIVEDEDEVYWDSDGDPECFECNKKYWENYKEFYEKRTVLNLW